MELFDIINLATVFVIGLSTLYFLAISFRYFIKISNLEFMRIRDDFANMEQQSAFIDQENDLEQNSLLTKSVNIVQFSPKGNQSGIAQSPIKNSLNKTQFKNSIIKFQETDDNIKLTILQCFTFQLNKQLSIYNDLYGLYINQSKRIPRQGHFLMILIAYWFYYVITYWVIHYGLEGYNSSDIKERQMIISGAIVPGAVAPICLMIKYFFKKYILSKPKLNYEYIKLNRYLLNQFEIESSEKEDDQQSIQKLITMQQNRNKQDSLLIFLLILSTYAFAQISYTLVYSQNSNTLLVLVYSLMSLFTDIFIIRVVFILLIVIVQFVWLILRGVGTRDYFKKTIKDEIYKQYLDDVLQVQRNNEIEMYKLQEQEKLAEFIKLRHETEIKYVLERNLNIQLIKKAKKSKQNDKKLKKVLQKSLDLIIKKEPVYNWVKSEPKPVKKLVLPKKIYKNFEIAVKKQVVSLDFKQNQYDIQIEEEKYPNVNKLTNVNCKFTRKKGLNVNQEVTAFNINGQSPRKSIQGSLFGMGSNATKLLSGFIKQTQTSINEKNKVEEEDNKKIKLLKKNTLSFEVNDQEEQEQLEQLSKKKNEQIQQIEEAIIQDQLIQIRPFASSAKKKKPKLSHKIQNNKQNLTAIGSQVGLGVSDKKNNSSRQSQALINQMGIKVVPKILTNSIMNNTQHSNVKLMPIQPDINDEDVDIPDEEGPSFSLNDQSNLQSQKKINENLIQSNKSVSKSKSKPSFLSKRQLNDFIETTKKSINDSMEFNDFEQYDTNKLASASKQKSVTHSFKDQLIKNTSNLPQKTEIKPNKFNVQTPIKDQKTTVQQGFQTSRSKSALKYTSQQKSIKKTNNFFMEEDTSNPYNQDQTQALKQYEGEEYDQATYQDVEKQLRISNKLSEVLSSYKKPNMTSRTNKLQARYQR